MTGQKGQQGGGTSQAAPIWAAITVLIDQYLHRQGLGPVGFMNPALYRLAATHQTYVPFHDVTRGSNLVYPAGRGYSLQYGNLPAPQSDNRSVGWGGSGSPDAILFAGMVSGGQGAQQLVATAQQAHFPDATFVYQIPGAELGYVPGYGAVYDVTETPVNGAQVDERIAITAAIHGNVGVVMISTSPLAPDQSGHPNPSQLDPAVAQLADDVGNTVTWKGMAPP